MINYFYSNVLRRKRTSVYFLHIPKTAGTSLAEVVGSSYPEHLAMPAFQIPQLLKLNREDINKFKCFTGHFGTGLFSLLDDDIPCITMLRDPFERAVSFFLYTKKFESPGDKPDFREIVNDPYTARRIENFQALYLGYDINLNNSLDSPNPILDWNRQTATSLEVFFVEQLQYGIDMNKIVENAKQRLDKMEVVGIVEEFNESTRLICKFLGIKKPKIFPKENFSPEKLSLGGLTYRESGQIPEDVISRIDELTVCDREIYEYGKTLFARQLRNNNNKYFFFSTK